LENYNLENSEIIEKKALKILEQYSGANNFILRLKKKQETNPKFYPTSTQSEYIINFHNVMPKVARKWVDIDPYFATKLSEDKLSTKVPTEIWVEKLLVEKDKSYHIWGKMFSGETLYDFWLPKSAIIKVHKVEKVEVDYNKYAHRPPMEHQKEAIEKLVGCRKFILADDMGVGKTTSTIIAALETDVKKVLIICTASLKLNWKKEIENYTKKSIYVCEGKKYEDADFVIMNYDIVKNFHNPENKEESLILKSDFDLIILDEAHALQNTQANRTKLVNSFARNSKYLWLLTGTPMTSRPINYYNLLNLIDSPVAQNWKAYVIRYCDGYQFKIKNSNRKIWNVNGASNLDELRERTSKQFLRRLKTDVLDLPEKIITPVYLRLKSQLYENLMGEYYEWYKKSENENASLSIKLSMLTKVRQVIAEEKLRNTIEICENILEQDKKVIIFTNFTATLQQFVQHFGKKCVYIDGSCNQNQRQYAVDEFQNNDKIKVFVGNLKAAGAGITLTAAEAVIMNDLSFVPSDHSQAEDRAYRIGQKNAVSVFYPIFDNTIEGIIYDILKNKKTVIDTVMGDNLAEGDILKEIMDTINNM
jgi:SWI/SNF-related matrix-associated actin-dependent regulator 1 of chromatin subfamily A